MLAIWILLSLVTLALPGCSVGMGGETLGVVDIGPNGVKLTCPTGPHPSELLVTGPASIPVTLELNLNAACAMAQDAVSAN